MGKARELRTVQFRIFEPYVLPFGVLMSSFGREALQRVFGFSQVEESPIPELYFRNGVIRYDEDAEGAQGAQVVMPSVHINERRIVLDVVGSTSDANAAFGTIFQAIMSLHRTPPENVTPMVVTHESTCVIELPFRWEKLLPDYVTEFLRSDVCQAASRESANANILSGGISVRLAFSSEDSRLQDSGITLSEKQMVIEPRTGTAAADRVYFVRAPTDTDSLLQLIAKMRKSFK